MDNLDLKSGDHLLIISSNQTQIDEKLVQCLTEKVGDQCVTRVSTVESSNVALNSSSFDAIITDSKRIDDQLLPKLFNLLKLNSKLVIIKESDCQISNIITNLKLNGFIDIRETMDQLIANKPNYETGSSVKLNLSNNKQTAKVWSLAAMDFNDDSVELINDDDLLDEEDLKKPSSESLRVCGTTKQRKACADCSCGLAEELEQQAIDNIKKNTQNAKSSCGSCYLGDAFRCASCPYLGMPAFKAGEKVVLDNSSDL